MLGRIGVRPSASRAALRARLARLADGRDLLPQHLLRGAPVAGLGLGGEGYLSYSIATTTGEGITTPKTFTRVRRCVLVENLRIV